MSPKIADPGDFQRLSSHTVSYTSPRLGRFLGNPLGLLLQRRHVAVVPGSVRLDGLLAIRRELRFPVARALALLVERVLLVLFVVDIRL